MVDNIKASVNRWNQGLTEPLRKTLIYAQTQIPYYSSRIKEICGGSVYDLLQCLPVLTKETAIDNLEELRKDKIFQPGRISTGTLRTGNRFMDVQHIEAEEQAIKVFLHYNYNWDYAYNYEKFLQQVEKNTVDDNRIFLKIIDTHYEVPTRRSNPNCIDILWTTHSNSLEIIAKTLLDLKQIDYLEIEPSTLIKLTLMLDKLNFDFSAIKVNTIVTYGFLANRWKHLIYQKWQAPFYDCFSLSEMRPKAFACLINNNVAHYHFNSLPVVTEVLHPKTYEPIDSGSGLLALTPLYPFVQQQVLLRYITQDIVNIIPCAEHESLGFSWCGRMRDVVFIDQNDMPHSAFGLRELIECLEYYYEIARGKDDFEMLGLIEPGSVGWPICKFEHVYTSGINRLMIHVILIYQPALYPERTEFLISSIREDLLSSNSYLRENVLNGNVMMEIIPYPPSKKGETFDWQTEIHRQIVRKQDLSE